MSFIKTVTKNAGPIGSGISLATGLVGLLSGGAANRRTKRLINEQQNFLDKEYLPDMNKRYLDTEEAQSFVSTLNDRLKEQNRQAEQVGAVTGGTDEAVLAAKESNSRAYADSLNKLAGMGTQYKQGLRDRYMQGKNQIFAARTGMNQQASQSGSNVFSNSMSTLGSLAMLSMLSK